MKNIIIGYFLILMSFSGIAQEKGKFEIEANFGFGANFFVRSYDESPNAFATTSFSNKNLLGSIGGADITLGLSKKSRLGFGYARSRNEKEINYTGQFIGLGIRQFNISHVNNFYQLFYGLSVSKNPETLTTEIGLFYVRPHQQEIEITDRVTRGGVLFEERSFKHYKLEEGGAFIGLQYQKKIDTKFYLGIKSRLYYTISTGEMEAITLTPTLSYHF